MQVEATAQQARNLALTLGERFEDIKFLIRDRGSNFTASFDAVFQGNGARILRTAAQRVPDDECNAPRATVTDIDTRQIRRKPVLGGLINEQVRDPACWGGAAKRPGSRSWLGVCLSPESLRAGGRRPGWRWPSR